MKRAVAAPTRAFMRVIVRRFDHYETVRQRKDGSLVDISITVSPIKNEKGEIIGASKIARDITQLKRARVRRSSRSHHDCGYGGEISRDWQPEGLVIRLSIPRERLTR
jgi:hypothetical protein